MTLSFDIENIDKIANIHKHHKKDWSTIYEVIQQEFFDKTDIFFKELKKNARTMQMSLLIYRLMSKNQS